MYEEEKGPDRTRITVLLVVMVCFFVGIMGYVMVNAANKKPSAPQLNESQAVKDEQEKDGEERICVLKAIHRKKQTMTLYDIKTQVSTEVTYNGGTDITDKYGKILSASLLEEGTMVDAVFDPEDRSLEKLQISTKTWEYKELTNLAILRDKQIIRIFEQNYRYDGKIYCRNVDGEITLLTINACDEVTVRGYDKTVYSIVVTKGHGTVRLENYDYFYGGELTIGTQDYTNLTNDMVLTVQEGKKKLTIEQGDVSGTKLVTVVRDEETVVDFSDVTPEPTPTGMVTFDIAPFGAKLKVDGEEIKYTKPVELEYGSHAIEVSLNGYETYQGSIDLEKSSDTVVVHLTKAVKEESEDKKNESDNSSENTESKNETTGGTTTGGNSSTVLPGQTQGTTGSTDNGTNSGTTNGTTNGTNNGAASGTTNGTTSGTGTTGSNENSNNTNSNGTGTSTSDAGTTAKNKTPASNDGQANSTSQPKTENAPTVDNEHTIYIGSPQGASVYINGDYQGIAPVRVKKPLGLTYITLLRDGYEQITHTICIENDHQDKTFDFPNLKATSSLK